LLECAKSDAAQTVLLVDYLALFRYAKPAVHRSGRRTQHGDMRLATAAANRATTAMKQRELDVLGIHRIDEHLLGVLDCPAGRGQAAVLVAIRIPNHDRLPIFATLQVIPVQVDAKKCFENIRTGMQVSNRLEQRRNVKRHFATAIVQLTPLGE